MTDSRRRRDIARRTRQGLDEDLEDLREELRETLPVFERRIRNLAAKIGEWPKVQQSDVLAVFELPPHAALPETWIGPRVVAEAAGEVEAYVHEWLPHPDDDRTLDLARPQLRRLGEETDALLDRLSEIATQVEAQRDPGHEQLDQQLDRILNYLDQCRESDIDALEDLVDQGQVETGHDARKERANLWEEQRKKADQVRQVWDELAQLLEDGTNYALDGLKDLAAMVQRTCEGIEGSQRDAGDYLPTDKLADARRLESLVEASDSEEQPELGETEEAAPTEAASDANLPPTVQLDDTASQTEDAPDAPEETASEDSDEAQMTLEDATEVERPEPATGHGPVEDHREEPQQREQSEHLGAQEGDAVAETPAPEEPASDQETAPDEGSDSIETAPERPSADSADSPESLDGIRIRRVWQQVPTLELVAAFGPPVLFVFGVVLIGLLHAAGLGGLPNPVVAWPWVESALVASVVWGIAAPLLLGWRPRWEGWSLHWVEREEQRHEATVTLEAEHLVIAGSPLPISEVLKTSICRWGDSDDDVKGWLLQVMTSSGDQLDFIAPADSERHWEVSDAPLVDPPTDAWQLSPDALRTLAARVRDETGESN
jgi:hypothetical protein